MVAVRKWFKKISPDRESMLANRWLRPMAKRLTHPQIWHFNRHSVARGLALGLFMGFILPAGQTIGAAVVATSVRGNLLVAAAATFITNPFTTVPILYAAFKTGSFLLSPLLGPSKGVPPVTAADPGSILDTLASGSIATILGLVIFATVASVTGYFAVHLGWRLSLLWQLRNRARKQA